MPVGLGYAPTALPARYLVCHGDSITLGYPGTAAQAYPALVEDFKKLNVDLRLVSAATHSGLDELRVIVDE